MCVTWETYEFGDIFEFRRPIDINDGSLLDEFNRLTSWLALTERLFIGRNCGCFYLHDFGVVVDLGRVNDLAIAACLEEDQLWQATVFALAHECSHAYHAKHGLEPLLGDLREAHADFIAGLFIGWHLPSGAFTLPEVRRVAFASGMPVSSTHPTDVQRHQLATRAISQAAWFTELNSRPLLSEHKAQLTRGELDEYLCGYSRQIVQGIIEGTDPLLTPAP